MDDLKYRLSTIPGGYHLSPIRRSDKAAYLEHLSDPEIAANMLSIPYPYTEEDADWWLSHCESHTSENQVRFAIRDYTGYLIGSIGIVGEIVEGSAVEIGYWLARSHRGKAIMPAAITCFAGHLVRTFPVTQLYATPFVTNAASHRTLEKAGFRKERVLQQHHRKNGVLVDAVKFVLSSDRGGTELLRR